MRSLLKLRQAFFRTRTSELYRSYTNAGTVAAVMFAPVLIKAPDAVSRPILAFRDDPLNLHANFLLLLAWFCSVMIWARIHRGFVRGGALPVFARSAPVPEMKLRLIDLWMLLTGMSLFFIPFLVGAYFGATAGTAGAAAFPFYFWLLLAATFSVAKDVIYGWSRVALPAHLFSLLVLLSPPSLDLLLRHPFMVAIAALLELVNFFSGRVEARRVPVRHLPRLQEKLVAHPALVHMTTSYGRFFGAHRHDLVARIVWSLLPLYAAWWLIVEADNLRDAPMILHLAFGAFVGVLSGAYKVLFDGRAALTRFARSTAHGGRMLALFDHLLVLTPGLLCSTAWLVLIGSLDMFTKLHLLALASFYLCVLVILGLQWIQERKQAMLIRSLLALAATALGANIL